MMKDLLGFCAFLIAFFVIMGALLFCTIGYGDGSAKSAYLKRTKGIDIPWYQATFLNVAITDNDVTIGKK